MPRHALVLGATGLVGSHCVTHIAASAAYDSVTCLVRRSAITTTSKVREHVVDFARLSAEDIEPAEDLFCAIGTTIKKAGSQDAFRRVDFEIPLRVAELAVTRGVKRIALVSSAGADSASSTFYLRTKGELEDALAKLPLVALHVMRPSVLLGERSETRRSEALAQFLAPATGWLFVGGIQKWRPISADDVARAMVGALTGPDPKPARQIHEYAAIRELAARVS